MGEMNERQSDFAALQQFARAGSQEAFRSVVRRHVDLVFATALRKVGDAGAAEEVAQNVFGALARKAWSFAPDDSLPAWLHKAALLESQHWLRGELRRRQREQTAAELGTTMKTPDESAAFNALLPLLDDALLSLRETDRTALLLRFYERRPLRDVGGALGVSEDTAQKRVATALEKLADFFQRRGYRTATVAAATAALQHTATSASAATVASVATAALAGAPPALTGIGAIVSRVVTMSKVQTVVLCAVVAIAPVLWQWSKQFHAANDLSAAREKLVVAQEEFDRLQTETEQARGKSAKLDARWSDASNAAAQSADTARRFAEWKKKIRATLLAVDYRWPEDSPFVRVHKSVLPQLNVRLPVLEPGVIKPEARELLGLSPQEREQAEAALQKYLTQTDELLASKMFRTNRSEYARVPKGALASQIFVIPALGGKFGPGADELNAALRNALGDERWKLVKAQIKSYGKSIFWQTLNLYSGERAQELAVWVENRDGIPTAGFAWSTQQGSIILPRVELQFLLPDAQFPEGFSLDDYLGIAHNVSSVVMNPTLAWLREQAAMRLGQKGDK